MPNKPDVPCNQCGKLMWRGGKGGAVPGKSRCKDCRNAGRGHYVTYDGRMYGHGGGAYGAGCRCEICVQHNRDRASRYMVNYRALNGEAYSSTWRRRFKAEHGFWPQGSGTEFVDAPTRRALYERDGWTCQLCNGAVDPDAAEHADRASLDHIVPQSRGGSHDPSNLRLAHVGCNARRRDRVDGLEGVP